MNYVSNDGVHNPTMFLEMNPRYALVCPLYAHSLQRTEQNFCSRCGKRTKDIHTCTPPQRTWVGLTDEEIEQSYETTGHYQKLRLQDKFAVYALAKAIEVKLKQKNGYTEENT
jgi:hypothetical protein